MDLHIPYTGAMPLRRPGHAKRDGLDQHLALRKGVTEPPNSALTRRSNCLVVGRASTAASFCGVYNGVCRAAGLRATGP